MMWGMGMSMNNKPKRNCYGCDIDLDSLDGPDKKGPVWGIVNRLDPTATDTGGYRQYFMCMKCIRYKDEILERKKRGDA